MTTIDPHAAGAAAVADERAIAGFAVVGEWVTSTDHKRIGRLFVGASLAILVAMTALGALLAFERIDSADNMIDLDALPQLFAMFRIVLTFGVVVPLMLGIAIAVVPLQLGARALAFPRMAAAGFWTWLVGAGLVVFSIAANGGPGGGDTQMVNLFLAAHILLLLGLLAGAGCVAASVLTTRAPGMNMRRIPMFAWSALAGALGMILMLPVLVGMLVLVAVDHRYGRSTFGGNVGVYRWIAFAFTQPQTFLYVLPAFGFAAEVVAVSTRRRLPARGIGLIGLGLVAVASFAGIAQVPAGVARNVTDANFGDVLSDAVPYALFNLLPVLGGLIILGLSAFALKSARPRITAPFVFGILGVVMIFTGMVGNVVYHLGDAQLAGTVFEEGAWIYVCYGAVLAALGAVAYWGPKLWGRRLDDRAVLPLAGLGFIATVLASLPYYVAGFAKQPTGVTEFDYSGPQNLWNALVMAGHALMLLTVLAFVGLAIRSFTRGDHAGDDPWDGHTLEWATTSPAPTDNFVEVHTVASADPLLDLKPSRSDA